MVCRASATLFLAMALALASAAVRAAGCDQIARSFAARLNISAGAMDEGGALVLLSEAAKEGLRACPDLEPQSYIAARIAELGYAAGARRTAAQTVGALALAQDAARRHPDSVRIATVLARLEGSLDAARRAMALDARYAPARVQLAWALAATGARAEALVLLSQGRDTERPASEWNARARIRLAAGEAKAAKVDAKAARAAKTREPELTPGTDIFRDTQETLGLSLMALGRPDDAKEHFELAAAVGSSKAKAALEEMNARRDNKAK